MSAPLTSHRKALSLSFILFLLGLAILTLTQTWWPFIMLVVGIPVAFRQYLLGRHYDMAVSLVVFIGGFITVQFNISWQIVLPVLFTIGGIYIFFKELFTLRQMKIDEEEEDINHEIEEDEFDDSSHHEEK